MFCPSIKRPHLKYMAFAGDVPLACIGWGSAAWAVQSREQFACDLWLSNGQSRFKGTCYHAASWVRVGETKGYVQKGAQAPEAENSTESTPGFPSYDPPSLFLLDLFRYIGQYPTMDKFLETMRDKDKGRAYRAYAGIDMDNIPTKGTFSNFKDRLKVRNDPKSSAKKQKIFGYNMIFSTSVEMDLKLELPVAVVNMAGNGKEGKKIIDLTKQARAHHDCRTKIDIADAKYDNKDNYTLH